MEQFADLIKEFNTSVFNFNVTCGIIAGIVVFIIEIKCVRKYKKKDTRKEDAVRKGHVIQAKRINMWDDGTTKYDVNSYYHAKYQYEISGQKYIYRYMGKNFPVTNISLYYKNNPRHVWSDLEKKENPLVILLGLIPLATMITVVYILGGV